MTTEQAVMVLSQAFSTVIMCSLVVAVGFGMIGGLAWLYLMVGKWIMQFVRKAYVEAIDAATDKKRVKA